MNRIMIVAAAALAALALVGCKKPAPKVAETEVPQLPAADVTGEPETATVPETAPEEPILVAPDETATVETPAGAEKAPKVYTVQKGDTLYGIARKFYGDQRRYKDIAKLNGIADPNLIYVGQVLKIPE